MHKKLTVFFQILTLAVLLTDCKKNNPKSSEKGISSFDLFPSANPGLANSIVGIIIKDSIYLPESQGQLIGNLTPTIDFTGVSITPDGRTAENFSTPVRYTVSAADGSTVSYVVVPKVLSVNKDITSFVFKAADNPGLLTDLPGLIRGDTIVIYGDSTTTLSALAPTITYTGVNISPSSGVKQDFSGPVTYTVTSEIGTVKNYTVIVSKDRLLYVGSDDGNLYALDAATGALIWKYATGGGIRSSPTLYNGELYFISYDSYVYALNAADGSLQWKYQSPQDGITTAYGSNPTVQSGIVYIHTSTFLTALDASTGSIRWHNDIGFYSANNSPTVFNGIVYDPTFTGGGPVVTFDALTGSRILNFPSGIGTGNPVVANGVVYSTDETAIQVAWDAQTGAVKWVLSRNKATSAGDSVPDGPGSSPTLYNGKLYVGGGAGIFALDPNTGSIVWQFQQGPEQNMSVPTGGDGLIFCASNYGRFYAFDAGTGSIKYWFDNNLKYNTSLAPTFSNGTLYFGGLDGSVNAIDPLSGQTKWSILTKGAVFSGPCVIDNGGKVHHPTSSGDQQ